MGRVIVMRMLAALPGVPDRLTTTSMMMQCEKSLQRRCPGPMQPAFSSAPAGAATRTPCQRHCSVSRPHRTSLHDCRPVAGL